MMRRLLPSCTTLHSPRCTSWPSSPVRKLSRKSAKDKFSPLCDLGEGPTSLLNYKPDLTMLNPHYTVHHPRNIPPLNAEADPSGVSRANAADIIDLSSMFDPNIHLPDIPDFNDPNQGYEVATPLGTDLMKYIGVLGRPITVADYMNRCLRDEHHGYYTNPPLKNHPSSVSSDADDWDYDDNMDSSSDGKSVQGKGHRLIGRKGDFTTAPEISQIFGECITIWLLTQVRCLYSMNL
jgi:hypothetical protein